MATRSDPNEVPPSLMGPPLSSEGDPRMGTRPTSVDVLIVSYNTRDQLEECVDSIIRHAPPDEEVTLRIKVFDNASSDGTVEMLGERFPTVELTRSHSNLGFAQGNNRLAEASRAEYLLLLNPDTVWIADVVRPLLESLRDDPEVAIAGPRLVFPDGRLQLSSQRAPSISYEFALPLRGTKLARVGARWEAERLIEETREEHLRESTAPRRTEFLWATCWLIARADVQSHGLFDPRFPLYDEDLDLCTRLRRAGRTILYRPDVDLVHIGGASSTSDAKRELMRAARTHYYLEHRGRSVALIYRYVVPWAWRLRLSRRRRVHTMG